ncbi:hypothetical protein QYM36_014291 [Artemia franciscana]|nr:hypothetical protein QYM36_014291 [Artemia franciscana]
MVTIWEEEKDTDSQGEQKSHWIKRNSLVDARLSVTDVKFAPKHLGLMLAACSADGYVRLYEAQDVMNLGQFIVHSEFHIKMSCSCISWNPCLARNFPPTLAIGSDSDGTVPGSRVVIYEYNETGRKWNRVESLSVVTDSVNDIAFAPNVGRSYHLLAVASKDIRVFRIKSNAAYYSTSTSVSAPALEVSQVFQSDIHGGLVWRLAWNSTGTMLASCGDDEYIRLWKANYMQSWKQVAEFKGDGSYYQSTTTGDQELKSQVGAVSAKFIKAGSIGDQKGPSPRH